MSICATDKHREKVRVDKADKEKVASLSFFLERMCDGILTKGMARQLWEKHVIYINGGVAHACGEHDFPGL